MHRRRAVLSKQPWITSAPVDSALILAPPFLATVVVLLFRDSFGADGAVPVWAWVSLILCIDVAHVYSTIFRTYFNREEFDKRRTLFTAVPLVCWVGGTLIYALDSSLFWRVLAYIAVYHFIRQQYGFLALYCRKEKGPLENLRWVDKGAVYLATLYPIAYWHTNPRNFYWFIDGDFVTGLPSVTDEVVLAAYGLLGAAYIAKECYRFYMTGLVNVPKQAVMFGTAASWYVGIVLLNGDMAFTVTNVVSHGIPYIGLIWLYGRKQSLSAPQTKLVGGLTFARAFSPRLIPLFIGVLLVFAYVEEGLWHGLVWRDYLDFFSGFSALPKIADPAVLALVVPLLALPQLTHYVLDGFIWRMKGPESKWRRHLFR